MVEAAVAGVRASPIAIRAIPRVMGAVAAAAVVVLE